MVVGVIDDPPSMDLERAGWKYVIREQGVFDRHPFAKQL
jgi:hypothetical protein